MGKIDFIEEPPEAISISREIVLATWRDGSRRAVPLDVFRIATARSVRALADYDATNADVIEFPAHKHHAASS